VNTENMIRDGGPYGPGLTLPEAIARLRDGRLVIVSYIAGDPLPYEITGRPHARRRICRPGRGRPHRPRPGGASRPAQEKSSR
jgi:hypothetical protein